MIENFYHKNNISEYFSKEEFLNLEKISIEKGEEIYLEDLFFLIDGKIELFLVNLNHDIIKIKNINSRKQLIGKGDKYKDFELDIFYRTLTKTTLLKVEKKYIDKLFNNFKYVEQYNEFIYNEFMQISKYLLIRNSYSSTEVLKYIFENEMDENNEIFIENNQVFIEKHKINRTIFYNGIKKLEKLKQIKQINKTIKILNRSFK